MRYLESVMKGRLARHAVGILAASLLLCLIPFLKAPAAPAYKDTFFIPEVNNEHLSEYYTYLLTPIDNPFTVVQADSAYRSGAFRRFHWHKTFNLGYRPEDVWLRIEVASAVPAPSAFLWSIYNYVDSVQLFRAEGDRFRLLQGLCGMQPPAERPYGARSFSLPFILASREHAVLYLRVVQRADNIYLPNDITTLTDYQAWERDFWISWNWYWLFGFYLFSMLFNFILFYFIRDKVHLWYAAYVLVTGLFLLMEDGLDGLIFPGWLYRLLWTINEDNFLLLSAAAGIGIMQAFIGQHPRNSRLYHCCRALLYANVALVVLYALLFPLAEARHQYDVCLAVNYFRDGLLVLSIGFTMASLAEAVLKRNRLAYYYSTSFFFFMAGTVMFFLNRLAVTTFHLVEPNELAIGLFLELFSLLFFITVRFQAVLRKNARLQVQELELQAGAAAEIIRAQDEERARLARDLHDDLGGTIIQIRLLLDKMQRQGTGGGPAFEEAYRTTQKAAADVRSISHALMPPDLKEHGLYRSLAYMTTFLTQHSEVRFELGYEGSADDLSPDLQLIAYRIFSELTHNILKHARARHSWLKCRISKEWLRLEVRDDGAGFDPATIVDRGIGLGNIRNRARYLGGSVTIQSGGAGTTVVVELPTGREEPQYSLHRQGDQQETAR